MRVCMAAGQWENASPVSSNGDTSVFKLLSFSLLPSSLPQSESRPVQLYVRLTPHLLPHSTWVRSCEPPAEGEEFRLAVGTLSALRYHRLSDVEPLVSNALQQYCLCLDTVGQRSGGGGAARGSGRGFDDTHLELTDKVEHRYQLAKEFIGPIPKSVAGMENGNENHSSSEAENENPLVPGMENGNETSPPRMGNGNGTTSGTGTTHDKGAYVEYCRQELRSVQSQLVAMELSGRGVGRYSVAGCEWEAGKLPRRLSSKNLFSLFDESSDPEERAVCITMKG